MGVDIHMYVQTKARKDTDWQLHQGHDRIDDETGELRELSSATKWTAMFGHLAGIRSFHSGISDMRGLPDDAPDVLKGYVDERDGFNNGWKYHTPGWCTLRELETACLRAMKDDDSRATLKNYIAGSNDTTLFYDYRTISSDHWPSYDSIIRWGRDWIWATKLENTLAGVKTDLNKPQIRFLFYFDS